MAFPDVGGAQEQTLLGPSDVRALAARLGLRPTKTLGQNFVTDAGTVRRVVRRAEVGSGDVVLEVGPGLGSLTLALLEQAAGVVAVEVDPVLAAELPRTVARLRGEDDAVPPRLAVLGADALRVRGDDVRGAGAGTPTRLVANLPYNVAVPVLLGLLEELPELMSALVMVQAEVAERLAAAPGSRAYGVPSVKAAWYGRVSRAGAVGRTVFWPAPNVDSGLVDVQRREPPASRAGRRAVFAVVDAAFAQRRKTLRAALAGWAGSGARAEEALRAARVDPALRGERLDVAGFVAVADAGRDVLGLAEPAARGALSTGGRGRPRPGGHGDVSRREGSDPVA
ncbi:16S rRNA (adenine(1518)-N(6)/adenine(1519)-N(6))-dimethyltransferase RsmA [Pseudokineococcus sp. 1T1Z-3]|uniref:16S rRNA (adenine(1518)-N(6)/adenine(1519)-N(6))- dimethyltransferase RsmA n=1 Tax=Pseudokineococcus sp. 1T1Z-3 TaxID=3132745 RepID=UPI00309B0A99